MATVQVRYIVHDVDDAIAFYCGFLGFKKVMHPAPAFAMLSRGPSSRPERTEPLGRRRAVDARRQKAGTRRMESVRD
jgi:catechol 2,3-dioxygenase-like lactoylglutathione lyase family enzyme